MLVFVSLESLIGLVQGCLRRPNVSNKELKRLLIHIAIHEVCTATLFQPLSKVTDVAYIPTSLTRFEEMKFPKLFTIVITRSVT